MIEIAQNKNEIQVRMGRLTGRNGAVYSGEIQSYFEHYGLDFPAAKHHLGWFESRGLKLAGHVWMPSKVKSQKVKGKSVDNPADWKFLTDSSPRKGVRNDDPLNDKTAMVIVLHGYLNHTGQVKHLIASLLENDFAVGSFDLPGHGLSEGLSAAVGAFSDYTQALLDYILTIRPFCGGPLHFVGFSTGAGVGIDYLVHARQTVFDRIILAAPLIRWRGYSASKATYAFYRAFTDRVRRMPQKNSSDNNFLSFNRNDDYLHGRYVALDWVRALYDWNARLAAATPCDKEVFILQGDRDTTVDWRYNLGLLRAKFPAANVQMVKGARHELFNESIELREDSLAKITVWLAKECRNSNEVS
ncbi:MAG: alpha/beta hydrolase [Planctomycetes bacterium]|nr:alpha/beta hydrolase [Planctomycetota bacterium]